MERYTVSEVKPYSHYALFSKPYSVQNMLIVQCDFPPYFYEGDTVCSIYNDRTDGKWAKVRQEVGLSIFPDKWIDEPSEKLRRFAEMVYGSEITGLRIVRFTHASNGYPVWRLDIFKKGENTPIYKHPWECEQ